LILVSVVGLNPSPGGGHGDQDTTSRYRRLRQVDR
jgi:hypothetical protein